MKQVPAHLEWDSNFFGIKTAQLYSDSDLDNTEFRLILDQLRKESYKLLYLFFKTEQFSKEKEFLALGGYYVGSRVTLETTNLNNGERDEAIISVKEDFKSEKLERISIQSGEYSRFNLDRKIPEKKFEELYRIWIEKSVSRQLADEVLVYTSDLLGMITLKQKEDSAEIGLLGVDREARGKGIGQKLIQAAKNFTTERALNSLKVVTQGENQPAMNLYQKCGFNVIETYYTYHFWL